MPPKAPTLGDLSKVASWWPATTAEDILVKAEPSKITSNVFSLRALPTNIHFLKIFSEGNPLKTREQMKGAIPKSPAYAVQGEHAVSFASASDLKAVTRNYDIVDALVLLPGKQPLRLSDSRTARESRLRFDSTELWTIERRSCRRSLRTPESKG